jgi:hypothetical protein
MDDFIRDAVDERLDASDIERIGQTQNRKENGSAGTYAHQKAPCEPGIVIGRMFVDLHFCFWSAGHSLNPYCVTSINRLSSRFSA